MFLVKNHCCIISDASDASGFKIPTQVALELDAVLSTDKGTNSEDFWKFSLKFCQMVPFLTHYLPD